MIFADELAFGFSCSPDTGRLLRALASVRPDGVVAESGSGTGYGAAWLLDGLGRPAAEIIATWRAGEEAFRRERQPYLLY